MTLPMTDEQMQASTAVATATERFIRGEAEAELTTPVDENAASAPDELTEQKRAALIALYGDAFPLVKQDGDPDAIDWVRWAEHLWTRHESSKRTRQHLAERNRLMRNGVQWISSTNLEKWREPPKPNGAARVVNNVIGPALDQRVQLVTENRPGFKTKPVTQDPDDIRKAEAQQILLEYSYDEQKMGPILAETTYWNGTDGVAFWQVYWDPDAGPWHEEFADQPEVLDAETGEPIPQEPTEQEPVERYPMGDVRTRVLRLDQVVVSANATANERPDYWVIRERIPLAQAVARHGAAVADASQHDSGERAATNTYELLPSDDMMADQETVLRFTVFCEPSEFLPEGLVVVVVGDIVALVSELPCGVVPMVRVPDGSADPSFYPRATMDDWVDHQVRINVLLSRWVDSIRVNSGGRFFSRPKAVSQETLVGGLHSIIEVRGTGSLAESVQPVPNFSVGQDVKDLLMAEMQAFEAKSGWSAESRGKFSSETSGRAILASREALERVHAMMVRAAAIAMTDWSKITLAWAKWGYTMPRMLGVVGSGRPDLARAVSAEDLDGVSDVEIDWETLMPMPRALKMFMLDQAMEKGILTPTEYRQRLPFAYIRDMQTPDTDHYARARRVAEAIRQMQPPPLVKWQDNEAIHQDVLEREIILRDDLDPNVVMAAEQRWMQLAQQAQMKAGGMPPPPAAPPPDGGGGESGFQPSPQAQPLLLNNPGIAAAPVATTSGFADEMMKNAVSFDGSRPQ